MSVSPGLNGPGTVFMIKTSDCVPTGTLLQDKDGEIPLPSQVTSFGRVPPSLKSGLLRISGFTELLAEVGALTTFLNKIVLSSFRSEDHTRFAEGAQSTNR